MTRPGTTSPPTQLPPPRLSVRPSTNPNTSPDAPASLHKHALYSVPVAFAQTRWRHFTTGATFQQPFFVCAFLKATTRAFHAAPLVLLKAPKQHLSSRSRLIKTPWNVRSHTPSHFHTRFHSCDATYGECGQEIHFVFTFLFLERLK